MINKFKVAFEGLLSSCQDRSILTQYLLGILALVTAWILHCSYIEWIAIILCIGMVVVSEIINTCIERLCDLYTKERNPEVKRIKDLSAAAVMFASITALIVALIILWNHLQKG